jgi:enoyl-CoA hydratase
MIRREARGDGGRVQLVTIDRPERRNALGVKGWSDLADAILAAREEEARVIVVTGAGSAFSAGADLNESNYVALAEQCERSLVAISSAPMPVIACVNGPAIAAGLQLAVACDLRVAGPTAKFGIPAAAISRPVNPALVHRIAERAGLGAATAMFIGGEVLDVETAHRLGLVERLGDLEDALGWADTIAGYAPLLLENFKTELAGVLDVDQPRFRSFVDTVVASDDYSEALLAHREKRKPRYTGR